MSSLQTLKMAQNKIPSIDTLYFISAPKLIHLDLAENFLETTESKIAHMYPGLTSLDVRDNELLSLSGLEHLAILQTSTLLETKSLQYQYGYYLEQED